MIASLYLGCASLFVLEGFGIASIVGVLCMATLVTYMLTRIYPDVRRFEDSLTSMLTRLLRR